MNRDAKGDREILAAARDRLVEAAEIIAAYDVLVRQLGELLIRLDANAPVTGDEVRVAVDAYRKAIA